jgi:hypothetical protein
VCKSPGGMVIAEPGPRSKPLVVDLDDQAAREHVVGLRPSSTVQRRGRAARCVDLEQLLLIIGMSRIDLDGDDGVGTKCA